VQAFFASLQTARHVAERIPWRMLWRRHAWQLLRVQSHECTLRSAGNDELRRRSLSLQYQVSSGESRDRLLPEAFALVREAARRQLGLRPHDVQVLGGIAMHYGCVAEMQTGEGKTLAATMPLYLAALGGQGAHLATANDYLAARDADLMRPAFESLGLSVGVVQASSSRAQRRAAYNCDITYAAAREFGFDFLRDRLECAGPIAPDQQRLAAFLGEIPERDRGTSMQRQLHFALVDEADSILIDEARTPLIVSSLPSDSAARSVDLYRWSMRVAGSFSEDVDYRHDVQRRELSLTLHGRRKVRELQKPGGIADVPVIDLYTHVERALRAQREFLRDRHYVVRNGEVVIVDEYTGRLAEGRRWRDGLHQAIEAKENLDISLPTAEAARITVQEFYLLYQRLAGMTGTAVSSRREFRRIYRLAVRAVPTHRRERRVRWTDRVFHHSEQKWDAIVEEIGALHRLGRPVLVGTRSIDRSEALSQRLSAAGIPHAVLNARHHAEEALIVAQAGQPGRVTVATNMAGRGTDIQLAADVAERGGLHVICTELHESARIDRQLIGRCARQGDQGSYRQFMALDDELLRLGSPLRTVDLLQRRYAGAVQLPPRIARIFRRAQAHIERQHYRQRRLLLYRERERRTLQREMGQDPYLDSAE